MLRPEDFATKEEAVAYVNRELDRINSEIKDLEYDMVALSENHGDGLQVVRIANKWQVKAAEMQEGGK